MEKIFDLLKKVTTVQFQSTSQGNSVMEWHHTGNGQTKVTLKDDDLYFLDNIRLDNGLCTQDKKMWKLEKENLELWRYRTNKYEKIFSFSNPKKQSTEYVCMPDVYCGSIETINGKIHLKITIRSQKKNELIEYYYS